MIKLYGNMYYTAIKTAFDEHAYNMRQPIVQGNVAPLVIVKNHDGDFVCKFNDAEIVRHNVIVSNLLADHKLPISRSSEHNYMDMYFETYKYNPDKTLAEMIPFMNQSQIMNIYKQLLDFQAKISRIPTDELVQTEYMHFSDVYKMNIEHNKYAEPVQFFRKHFYHRWSNGSQMRLLHNDLNPNNFLISDDFSRITGIIDFDEISLCDESFSVANIIRNCPLKNVGTKLIEHYENATQHSLDREKIYRILKSFDAYSTIKQKWNALCKKTKKHAKTL